MSQNVKFKVKEFQWFQMQTKVRQIIQQIAGPLQKRILQSSSILNKVKSSQQEDQKKIEQISLMIANDPKVFQTGIFATVDKKFEEHYKLIQQLSRQIQEQNKYVQQKFKIMDLRMQQTNVVLMNMASLKQRVSKEMEIQNDNINSLRKNIQLMIEDLNKDLRQTRQEGLQNLQACQKKDHLIEQQIRKVKQNIFTIEDNIGIHQDLHRQKSIHLEQIDRRLKNNQDHIQDLQQTKDLTKKLTGIVEDMDNQLSKALFKIDTMGPLITQAQISDCLSSILPPKFKKKISIFEYKKYFNLNQQVLQKDYKNAKSVFDGLKLVQMNQKKCTKEIVQLKRKKLLAMGIDIDHLTYEQRQKYYSQVSLQQQLYMDQQQTQVSQKIDEDQIKKILEKFLQKYMAGFKQQIKVQIQDNKQYLYGIQQEIRYQISKFENKVSDTTKQCSTFHAQHLMEIKFHSDFSKSLDEKINNLKIKVKQNFDLQRMFYNFCSLLNHLQIQDEIDKQNISLMGVQQNNTSQDTMKLRERNSIVALQNKCFSCNGFPATTVSAFKMACLAYNPSSIKIDSKDYKRQELLQFTTNMLQNIKKSIQEQIIDEKNQKTESNSQGFKKFQQSRQFHSNTVTIEQPQERNLASFFKSKQIQTQETQNIRKKSSNNKFRKTRKSLNTTFSSSTTKQKSGIKNQIRQDMLNTSAIFNSIRKKNLSFLNI